MFNDLMTLEEMVEVHNLLSAGRLKTALRKELGEWLENGFDLGNQIVDLVPVDLCQCPFCGSAPRVYQTEYRIMCSSQSCPVRPSVFSNDLNVAEVRWNSRPEINVSGIPVVVDPPLPPGVILAITPKPVDEETGEVS